MIKRHLAAITAGLVAITIASCSTSNSSSPISSSRGGRSANSRVEKSVVDSSRSPQSGARFGVPWSAVNKPGKGVGVSCPLLINTSSANFTFVGVEPRSYDRSTLKFVGFRLVLAGPHRSIQTTSELGVGDEFDFLKMKDYAKGAIIQPEVVKQSNLYPVLLFEVLSPRRTEIEGCRLLFNQGGSGYYQDMPLSVVLLGGTDDE